MVRGKLHDKGKVLIDPRIFTLTVDRKRFAGPEEAYARIGEERFVARLMRLLGVKWWVAVLEFQDDTGDGWPHWHILLDLAEVGGRLDLKKAWRLWRDSWHLGGLDLGERKRGFRSTGHAINYITKYLTKYPKAGFPQWVLNRRRLPRFVMASKAVGRLVSAEGLGTAGDTDEEPEEGETAACESVQPRKAATECIAQRAARCGSASVVLVQREVLDRATGELCLRHQFMGCVPGSPELLAKLLPDFVQAVGEGRDRQFLSIGDVRSLVNAAAASEAVACETAQMVERQADVLYDTAYNRRKAKEGPAVYYAHFLADEERELLECL